MKIAIMQPYFLPYIGYFQLINSVDEFVFFDDVNYIKKGWINRNNFLVRNKICLFSVNLSNASQNQLIKDVRINYSEKWKDNFIKMLKFNYSKTKNFEVIYPLIMNEIEKDFEYISDLNISLIIQICNYLGLKKRFTNSSVINYDKTGRGEGKILSICKLKNATQYINAIGGAELYNKDLFASNNIRLSFIQSQPIVYNQSNVEFVPHLSIIDVLMFCNIKEINELLNKWTLV